MRSFAPMWNRTWCRYFDDGVRPRSPTPCDDRRIGRIGTGQRARTDLETFVADRLLIDATAYRLGSIGEHASKLEAELKARHPEVEWRRAYDMRNALFHDYEGMIPALLFDVTRRPLDLLLTACREELNRSD